MKYYCADCGELVADVAGKVKRGTVMICRQCDQFNEKPVSRGESSPVDLPDGFEVLFGGKR